MVNVQVFALVLSTITCGIFGAFFTFFGSNGQSRMVGFWVLAVAAVCAWALHG